MTEALYALFGWVAGLFSTVLLEWNRDHRLVKSARTAMRFELVRFRYRMAAVVFMMSTQTGTLSSEGVQWLLNEFAVYPEPDKDTDAVLALQTLEQHPQEAAAVFANFALKLSHVSPALKKYPVPALQNAVSSVGFFPPKEQKEILELATLVTNYEAVVEESWRFFQMTFDNSLTPHNRQIVDANIKTAYLQAAGLCRRIADQAARVLSAA